MVGVEAAHATSSPLLGHDSGHGQLDTYQRPGQLRHEGGDHNSIRIQIYDIGGWGERNREIVSFRSCVRTRGLVVKSELEKIELPPDPFPFPFSRWRVFRSNFLWF